MEREGNWRERLKAQERSGQTGAAYCREHGIPEKTFHYWRRKLKEERGGRFVKVGGGCEPLRITRGSITVEISANADVRTIRNVFEALDAHD